jgi:hypothetical protein
VASKVTRGDNPRQAQEAFKHHARIIMPGDWIDPTADHALRITRARPAANPTYILVMSRQQGKVELFDRGLVEITIKPMEDIDGAWIEDRHVFGRSPLFGKWRCNGRGR